MSPRQLVVVMGVSGSGKSTVGAALARRLQVPFADGDDFHPPANVAKMRAGQPLDDDDRRPWLDVLGQWLQQQEAGGVLACSALRRSYRDRLRAGAPDVVFVHLAGRRDVITGRQATRPRHFMPTALVGSQFSTLEPLEVDERGVVVDVEQAVDDVVTAAVAALAAA